MGWYAYLCAIVGAIVLGSLAGWIIGLGPTYQVVRPGTAVSVPNSTGKSTVAKTVTVIPSGTVLGSANVGGGVPSGVSYRIIDGKKVAN